MTWLPRSRTFHAFLGGDYRTHQIGALFEFGKVFDRLESVVELKQSLNVDATQRWNVQTMTKFLGANVANQVCGCVGMANDVTIEAGHAAAGLDQLAVASLIELLLGKGCDEQPKSFNLSTRIPLEEFEVIIDRDQFALGNVS